METKRLDAATRILERLGYDVRLRKDGCWIVTRGTEAWIAESDTEYKHFAARLKMRSV
jgi:hypothetical protein